MEIWCDKLFKKQMTEHLTKKGWTVEETSLTRFYDLAATKGNATLWMELKWRNVPSTKYGDNVCELVKYQCFVKNRDKFTKALLISKYTDGKIGVSDILNDEFNVLPVKAKKTTHFSDHTVIDKQFVSFPNPELYDWCR